MRPCRHGFDPETGPGLWCPACDRNKPGRLTQWWHGLVARFWRWDWQ